MVTKLGVLTQVCPPPESCGLHLHVLQRWSPHEKQSCRTRLTEICQTLEAICQAGTLKDVYVKEKEPFQMWY